RGVELEVGAVAVRRRLDRPAVQLDELPAAVLDTRVVHVFLQSISLREGAGDALTALIELEQHVLAYLILRRVLTLTERDPRSRIVPSETAGVRTWGYVLVDVDHGTSERTVL